MLADNKWCHTISRRDRSERRWLDFSVQFLLAVNWPFSCQLR